MTTVQLEFVFIDSTPELEPLTHLDLCLDLLRPYVRDGWSLSQIRKSWFGWGCRDYAVRCDSKAMTVTRFRGKDSFFRIAITDVFLALVSESQRKGRIAEPNGD
jgi:hypothetical protein